MLFSDGKDAYKEKWEGSRTSHEDIVMHFKADDAQPISAFPSVLKSLVSRFSNVFLDIPPTSSTSRRGARGVTHKSLLKVCVHESTDQLRLLIVMPQYLSTGGNSTRTEYETVVESINNAKLKALAPEVAKLRDYKSESEQRIMRAAADISSLAHAKVSSNWGRIIAVS